MRELEEKHNPDPVRYFEEEVAVNIKRMADLYDLINNGKVKSQIIWDDIRTLRKGKYTKVGEIDKFRARHLPLVDLVITSPPYINAQKYVRTLKFEMVLLGLVPYDQLQDLDQSMIGTERIYEKDCFDLIKTGDKLADTTLEWIYKKNRKRATIVARFYQDMAQGMKNIHGVMRPGGRFVLVIGNNLVFNQRVQNHQILANIARDQIGFHVDFIARDEIRSRGLITKRHDTSGIIGDEWVISMSKH
jgi:DNA modification methylase